MKKIKITAGTVKKIRITRIGILMLLLAGILLAGISGEVLIRKFFYLPLEKEYLRFSCFDYKKIPLELKDPDLFWRPVEEFKGIEYAREKLKDTIRVICIGDSITQGLGKDKKWLPREQTYPYKLEKWFNSGGKMAEVINAGSGGYSSLQGLRYLKKILWQYNPDLVISWFGVNDSFYAMFYTDKQQNAAFSKADKKWQSQLYLFLKNFKLINHSVQYPEVRVPPLDFYDNCEQMLRLAEEKKFKIVFISPFMADLSVNKIIYLDEYRDVLNLLEKKHAGVVMDIKPYFMGQDLNRLFIDSCHLNEQGNELVAEAIGSLLRSHGFGMSWCAEINLEDE